MSDIDKIYSNNFGISFKWKKTKHRHKTQIIFRDTGMLLIDQELKEFLRYIQNSLVNTLACNNCIHKNNCKSILLETPAEQISFAVNYEELLSIENLVKGTLFNLELNALLDHHTILKHNKE